MRASGQFLTKCEAVLNSRQQSLFYAAIFAALPFTAWLSVALVALITLRKGKEIGFNILLPSMLTHILFLLQLIPISITMGIVSTLITYLPAFIAAVVLKKTANWAFVFGALMVQLIGSVIVLDVFFPKAVLELFGDFQAWVVSLPNVTQFIMLKEKMTGRNTLIMAHIYLGIRVLLVLASTLVSLLLARFIQSRLYYPGAFKKEIQAFRCGKIALSMLLIISISAYLGLLLSIDLLPFLLFYFLLSGLLVCRDLFPIQKKMNLFALFVISLLISLKQICVLGIFFGILDSLFNIRVYFSRILEKSI